MIKKLGPLLFLFFCHCESFYQRISAENIKDMLISVKAVDTTYAHFYQETADKLLSDPAWIMTIKGKSQTEIIQNYQDHMKNYDEFIHSLTLLQDKLGSLAQSFDKNRKLDVATIQIELQTFTSYQQLILDMLTFKIPLSDSIQSLTQQICTRNNQIATFYKFPLADCSLSHK